MGFSYKELIDCLFLKHKVNLILRQLERRKQVRKRKKQFFIKDTTEFVSFIEKTKIGKDTILLSMDDSSLFKNMC